MAKYSDFWDKQVVDKPIATNYKGGTYTAGLQNAIATPKLSYSEFLKANVGNGGAVASSFPTSQQTNYGNILSSYQMPTQTAPKVNYGEVDLETGETTGGAYTDRRGRQFPRNNNSSGEIDLETGGAYTDNIDKYNNSLETQRQQALNQIEVNRQLGKSTYGVTAEQLGQAGLTGSGYAQFLDNQNEMMAEEAKKGLEVAVEDEKTTFQTDDGKTVQYKNAEEISKGIDSGTIGSVSALNTINSRGIITEEEYKTLTDKLQGKTYERVYKAFTAIEGDDDAAKAARNEVLTQMDSLIESGELSQAYREKFYYDDILNDYKSGEKAVDIFDSIDEFAEKLGTKKEALEAELSKDMTSKAKTKASEVWSDGSLHAIDELKWLVGYSLQIDGKSILGKDDITELRVSMGTKGGHSNSAIVKNADIGQIFLVGGELCLKAASDNYLLKVKFTGKVDGQWTNERIKEWYEHTEYNLG